jgi:hypothetical protein
VAIDARERRVLAFDLHGQISIQLVGASVGDVAAVERQLGRLPRVTLWRQPDLCVRFVERLQPLRMRYVELRRSGFTEDGFFVRSRGLRPMWARVPFDAEAGTVEIVCERGGKSVPLLLEFLRLVALRKGLVPLHASAFKYEGTGVLVAGWAHSGKSSALLAFGDRGAELVGDDMVLVSEDGRRMFGIAPPIELSEWQIRQLPHAWSRVGIARRWAFRGIQAFNGLEGTVPGDVRQPQRSRLLQAAVPALERRLRVPVAPELICPRVASAAEPRKLFIMLTHEASEIRVEPADHEETVQRMLHLARHEELSLRSHYHAYGFAFPGRTNDFLEHVLETGAKVLRGALSGVETYTVSHPRPVSFDRLFEAMEPACAVRPMHTPATARAL